MPFFAALAAIGAAIVKGITVVATAIGKVAPYVARLAPVIAEWISSSKSSIADAPAYDEKNATIDQTAKMNEVLTEKRNSFKEFCVDLEKVLQNASKAVFDNLIKSVQLISKETGISISLEYLTREFEKYNKDLKGGISDIITKRLALSDSECAAILKKEADAKRSKEIDAFIHKIIGEGFKKYQDKFDDITNQAFSTVRDRTTEKIQEKEIAEEAACKELDDMNRELSSDEIKSKENKYRNEELILNDFIRLLESSAA